MRDRSNRSKGECVRQRVSERREGERGAEREREVAERKEKELEVAERE